MNDTRTPLCPPPGGNVEKEKNVVRCPFCGSLDTAQEAAFGTTHAYSQYYCHACRTPFEWIKWEDVEPVTDLPKFLHSA